MRHMTNIFVITAEHFCITLNKNYINLTLGIFYLRIITVYILKTSQPLSTKNKKSQSSLDGMKTGLQPSAAFGL